MVWPAVIGLHLGDGVVLPEANETPFPVERVPAAAHRGVGVTAAGENHRGSPDDVTGGTDRQGHSVRRI